MIFMGREVPYERIKEDARSSAYRLIPALWNDAGEHRHDAEVAGRVLKELLEEFPEDPMRSMWESTLETIERYLEEE